MVSFFGTPYPDEQLVQQAEQALIEEPMLSNMTGLGVTSQDGVVTIRGTVNSERERQQVSQVAHRALEGNGLKFAQIRNEVALR